MKKKILFYVQIIPSARVQNLFRPITMMNGLSRIREFFIEIEEVFTENEMII